MTLDEYDLAAASAVRDRLADLISEEFGSTDLLVLLAALGMVVAGLAPAVLTPAQTQTFLVALRKDIAARAEALAAETPP